VYYKIDKGGYDRAIAEATAQAEIERGIRIEKENALKLSQERLFNDLAKQKSARAAAAVLSAGQLRDYQNALDSARSAASCAPGGTNGAIATVASECPAALEKVDGFAKDLADKANGLQRYVESVCVK
jgi:ABC-type branched-subunit amino acid transport system substrate-binding protein